MTRTVEPPDAPDLAESSVRPEPNGSDVVTRAPARATGVELLGQMEGSGYRNPPFLVRRADGQTLHLTPLLYAVLQAMDGTRTADEIGADIGARIGRTIGGDDVAYLIDQKLAPRGLVRSEDGSEPQVKKMSPLLAIRGRIVLAKPEMTQRIASSLAFLFKPPVWIAMMTAFVIGVGWLLFDKGLASPLRGALYEPELLLLVFGLTILSGAFHEMGHAAACSYGGATPGAMGAGLYLVWPVFYTDVTDSYRLDKRGRVRTDLGGLYFNAVFAVAMFGLWGATGWDAILLVIPVQLFQMLQQLPPFLRLDGYHVLADLTGVPDLFARIKPTLLSALPWRRTEAGARELRPWARRVVTLWVFLVIPILIFSLVMAVIALPRVAATAWDSIGRQWDGFTAAWSDGDPASSTLRILSILAIVLPVASLTYLLTRVTRRAALRASRTNEHTPGTRLTASVVAFGLVLLTVWGLWPNGQYRPVQPGEQGTLFEAIAAVSEAPGERADGIPDAGDGVLDLGGVERALALGDLAGIPAVDTTPITTITRPPITVVFEVPEHEGPGHNLAVALNTQDFSTIFDLAFSIEWVADGIADQSNEAVALASCLACTTVAVAFQIVLVSTTVNVIIPENTALALNVACALCVTFALASQLVLTVDEPLSVEEHARIAALWAQIQALEDQIDTIPIAQLQAELEAIKAEIVEIVTEPDSDTADDPAPGETATTTTSPTTATTAPSTTTTTAPPP